jgi:hypothetical protein
MLVAFITVYCMLMAVITVAAMAIRLSVFILRAPARVLQARLATHQKAGARELHDMQYFTGGN